MTVTPNAIPVHVVAGYVRLCPDSVERLFGTGYELRGTEHVTVEAGGREHGRFAVRPGSTSAVVVDAVHAAVLVKAAASALLRGPAGTRPLPQTGRIPRRLVLPKTLMPVWKVAPGAVVSIELGDVVFTGVEVAEGAAPGLELSEPDFLTAGGELGRLIGPSEPKKEKPCEPCTQAPVPPRLVTENDIRKARMERRRVVLQPGQLITPAARSLAKELGILDEPAAM